MVSVKTVGLTACGVVRVAVAAVVAAAAVLVSVCEHLVALIVWLESRTSGGG